MANEPTNSDVLSSVNVMVVDDDEFAQLFVIRILGMIGTGEVLTANNGADALERLADTDIAIDLIISDIEMPEVDGYEFVRKVRYGVVPKYKDVPILILTGKDTDENAQKARFHKIDGFIVKPPNAEDLERKLRKALGL